MTDKKVVIYSTPTCPWCQRAKEYFSQKDIPYLEYNVAENKDAAKEMIRKSGQMGVPVISIGDQVVMGFDQGRLDSPLS
jgi:glutaredoxin-like YruB-family protein